MKDHQPVVVTTAHRGVFFGYVDTREQSLDSTTLVLKNARNGVYWSPDIRGFLGLASDGPSNGCRIGPAAPCLIVQDITSVAPVTEVVAERWEAAPWAP